MRKSIVLLMLLGLTSTALAACGGGDAESGEEVEAPANQNLPAAAPNDDGGEDGEDDNDGEDEDGNDQDGDG